jgi:hypothetical protein
MATENHPKFKFKTKISAHLRYAGIYAANVAHGSGIGVTRQLSLFFWFEVDEWRAQPLERISKQDVRKCLPTFIFPNLLT